MGCPALLCLSPHICEQLFHIALGFLPQGNVLAPVILPQSAAEEDVHVGSSWGSSPLSTCFLRRPINSITRKVWGWQCGEGWETVTKS